MEAKHYIKQSNQQVQCQLCPHNCLIKSGKFGKCKIRYNKDGVLVPDSYLKISALAIDPIEKKPLYHFYPGKSILSIGSVGCNFICKCCQNHHISQVGVGEYGYLQSMDAEKLVEQALFASNNIGVAYTYNEPFINFETVYELAGAISNASLKNVIVSNGYINIKPLHEILPLIDAFNIDFKTYNEETYRTYFGGDLQIVWNNLELIKKTGKHLEITYLVIEGLNDECEPFANLVHKIANELGEDVVLHISRSFPRYKSNFNVTSFLKLNDFFNLARQKLKYVYVGNSSEFDTNNTNCPKCNTIVINREGYSVNLQNIDNQGSCKNCGFQLGILV